MPSATRLRVEAQPRVRPWATQGRPGLVLVLAVALVILGFEVDAGWRALHSAGPLTAQPANNEVLVFAGGVIVVALVALLSPGRWRWLAVIGPALVLAGVLAATATLGGHLLAMVCAVLIAASAWWTGVQLLRRVGATGLAEQAAVAWLAGLGPLCLLTLLLGRLSLFKWWTMGIVVVVTGALGCAQAGRLLWTRRRRIAAGVGGTSLGATAVGVIMLTVAAAAIYTSAPEIQFDPLYGKAYLPMLWAQTGTIGALNGHVQLNIAGWFQLVAAWGNLLGAPATGRYLQLLALVATPVAVWSWGARRSNWLGPIFAVAVAVTPTLFWQATTADDDLLLALAVFALAAGVFQALQPGFAAGDRRAGLAIGLLAGTGMSLKSHLIPIAIALLAGWMLAGGRARLRDRIGFGLLGALITGAPPLILRWIDTGNPVFPAYNNIFHSPYWLPINEKFNFPFWVNAGPLGPLKAIWDANVSPLLMQEAAPPGMMGALIATVLLAVVVGWRYRASVPGSFVLWVSIVFAVIAWWIEFRYLRYLLPAAFASVALLLAVWRPDPPRRAARTAFVLGAALFTGASFAVSVAMFWNVPNHKVPVSASIGRWATSSYLATALGERQAFLAYNQLSPPHSRMVTDGFERAWLTQGRDLDAPWELTTLLELHGPLPTTGDAAYARVRAMGVGWALVTAADRGVNGTTWLPELLRTHGQPRYSGQNWDLYQLVARPSAPQALAACDRLTSGAVSACWTGPRSAAGVPAGPIIRTVAVCPGQEIDLNVTERAGGPPADVLVQFPGAAALAAAVSGVTSPGASQPTYATVPSGATQALLTVNPPGGAQITRASVSRYGPACPGS